MLAIEPPALNLVSPPTMQVQEMRELDLGGPAPEPEVAQTPPSQDNAVIDMYGKSRGGFGGNGKKSYDPYGY